MKPGLTRHKISVYIYGYFLQCSAVAAATAAAGAAAAAAPKMVSLYQRIYAMLATVHTFHQSESLLCGFLAERFVCIHSSRASGIAVTTPKFPSIPTR